MVDVGGLRQTMFAQPTANFAWTADALIDANWQ